MIDLAQRLAQRPLLGFSLMYPAPGIAERVGPDWDWMWIDGQHGEHDYASILGAVRASDLVQRPAVVRVPGHDAGAIGRALDTGASGVMVPVVETPEQAADIVRAAKFPPQGSRSYGGRRPIDRRGRTYSHPDQPQPVLVCQIESHAGLERVEEIAAVDGVDVVFFGPDDMTMRDGLPMDQPPPAGHFDAALQRVAAAAAAAGKAAGGVFATPEKLQTGLDLGYRLIVGTGDVSLLAPASQAKAAELRAVFAGNGAS